MSKINLKDFVSEQSSVVVFNNGVAGRVKNVSVEVTKKKPEDGENEPNYRINFHDENGGSVNLGVFYPKATTKENETHIRMNQLLSILSSINPNFNPETLPEMESVEQSYDYLCNEIRKYSATGRCNVFVTYGTKGRPSRYLGFRAYNIVEPVDTPDETTRLVPVAHPVGHKSHDYNDLMTRLQPTDLESEMDGQDRSGDTNDSENW